MRLIAHRDVSSIAANHPYRNLQSPACWIYNRDGTISPFWSPGDSQAITVQGMKRIENMNVRGVRAQGIVDGCCFIRTCIASCRAAGSRRMANAESPAGRTTGCPSPCCPVCSGACFWNPSRKPLTPANCSSSVP